MLTWDTEFQLFGQITENLFLFISETLDTSKLIGPVPVSNTAFIIEQKVTNLPLTLL